MNISKSQNKAIKYVCAKKFENTKNFQLPLKTFEYPDSRGHIRKVVYIPDADTIYQHEYQGDQKPKSVWFVDGELLVRPSDKNLIKILSIHPWRHTHYKKYDERIEALEKLNHNELIKKALKLIDQADIEQLKATAFAVLSEYSFNMDDAVMQEKLEAKAFDSPKWLISELTDPNFHTKQMAALSVLKGILVINPSRTAITWPSGKILVSVPPGQDAVKRLGEFLAENTNEAKITLQELGELNKNRNKPKKPTLDDKINEEIAKKTVNESDDSADDQEGLGAGGLVDMTIEEIQMAYETTLGKNPPHSYKTNKEWMLSKIQEATVTA